jgi:hypothetical protein
MYSFIIANLSEIVIINYVITQLTVQNCPTQQDDIIETINDILSF